MLYHLIVKCAFHEYEPVVSDDVFSSIRFRSTNPILASQVSVSLNSNFGLSQFRGPLLKLYVWYIYITQIYLLLLHSY